jgi:hypothetical protein
VIRADHIRHWISQASVPGEAIRSVRCPVTPAMWSKSCS